jgi:hypothetical protein
MKAWSKATRVMALVTLVGAVGISAWLATRLAAHRVEYPGMEAVGMAHLAPATFTNGHLSLHGSYYSEDDLNTVLAWYLREFGSSAGARPEVSGGNCLTFSKASQVAVLHQALSVRLCARTGGNGTWVEIGRRFGLAR